MTNYEKDTIAGAKKYGHYFVPRFWFESVDLTKKYEDWFTLQQMIVDECKKLNEPIRINLATRNQNIGYEIKEIFGENSKFYKYWKQNSSQQFPRVPDIEQSLRDKRAKWDKIQDEKKRQLWTATREKQEQELIQEAIIFLTEHGKKIGQDYSLQDAVSTANVIRFDELVSEKVKDHEKNGTWFEFNGQNCDDPCEGWNGSSRRCQCGNRRVSWSHEGNFKNMYIYGEAY